MQTLARPCPTQHYRSCPLRYAFCQPVQQCLRRASHQARSTAAAAVPTSVSTDGLVFPTGPQGAWDEAAVGSPVVRCYVGDDEQRWYMWYSGRGAKAPVVDAALQSSGSMGVAVSRDGVSWVRSSEAVRGDRDEGAHQDVGASVSPNGDWWTFDTCHLAPGDVQIMSNSSVQSGVGVYWCFYTGGDFQPVKVPPGLPGTPTSIEDDELPVMEGLQMRPGLAMSQDGRNWARIEGDHHTWSLFDVGQPGEWDELFVAHPQVMSVGPRDMRMFYHSWEPRQGRYLVGVATSPDGFRWTKQGVVFDTKALGAKPGDHDELGAAARHVVRDVDNRQYLMFYEAVAADGSRSVGLAVSKDATTWSRCPYPVLTAASKAPGASPAASSWDAGSVGAPCPVSMSGGKWRLYYGGRRGHGTGAWEGIGLALSVDGGKTFEGVPSEYKRRAANS
mmetsp:Transcript_28728/g.73066  ORF Transcript_28728/g.73066 Transcript_28728/m.73066 type:complete len:445 (-) Transcript_28728:259-1593(-)